MVDMFLFENFLFEKLSPIGKVKKFDLPYPFFTTFIPLLPHYSDYGNYNVAPPLSQLSG